MQENMLVFEIDIRMKKFKTYIYNEVDLCFDTLFDHEKPVNIESDNIKIYYFDENKMLYLLISESIYNNKEDENRPRLVREIFELILSAKDNIPSNVFTGLLIRMNGIKKIFNNTEKNIDENKLVSEENNDKKEVIENSESEQQ